MKILGVAGWSGAGKTTLIARIIPLLNERGVRVSTIKHAHHRFDIDRPGKDSYVHRMSGAQEVLVTSASRWALMHETRGAPSPTLPELLKKLASVDLVLIEGFKRDPHPKVEVHRIDNGKPFLHPEDSSIRFLVTDAPGPFPIPSIRFDAEENLIAAILTEAMALDRFLDEV